MNSLKSLPVVFGAILLVSGPSALADDSALTKGGFQTVRIASVPEGKDDLRFNLWGDTVRVGSMETRADHRGVLKIIDTPEAGGATLASGKIEITGEKAKHAAALHYGLGGIEFTMTVKGPGKDGPQTVLGVIKNRIWIDKFHRNLLEHQITIENANGDIIGLTNKIPTTDNEYDFEGDLQGKIVAKMDERQLSGFTGDPRLLTLAAGFRGATVNLFRSYENKRGGFIISKEAEQDFTNPTGESPNKKIKAAAVSEKQELFSPDKNSYVQEPDAKTAEEIAAMS